MRWRLGSLVFGMILVALAISQPASGHHSCNHTCVQAYNGCANNCNSDPGCIENCGIQFEWCNCYYCDYCP